MPGVNLHHQLYADQTIAKALVSNQTPYPDQEDMEQLLHLVAKGQGVPVYVMLPLDTVRPDRCKWSGFNVVHRTWLIFKNIQNQN